MAAMFDVSWLKIKIKLPVQFLSTKLKILRQRLIRWSYSFKHIWNTLKTCFIFKATDGNSDGNSSCGFHRILDRITCWLVEWLVIPRLIHFCPFSFPNVLNIRIIQLKVQVINILLKYPTDLYLFRFEFNALYTRRV